MRNVIRLTGCTLLYFGAVAHAGSFGEKVDAARAALEGGETDAAKGHLSDAEKTAEALTEVVDSAALARYWFYRGVADWKTGGTVDAGGTGWRMSLIVDNALEWDPSVGEDRDAEDFFLALNAEVRSRPRVDPGVPDATGEARVYVDGIRVRAGDLALEGSHLAQIRCPDLSVHSTWTSFSRPVKYFKMCPNGVDTTVVVEEAVEEDDFDDMGPAFGAGDDAGEAQGPPPDPDQSVTDTIARGAGLPTPEESPEVEVVRKKVIWPAFAGGVAAAGMAGTLQLVALSQNRAYNDVSNPDYQTADELATLRKKTNRNQTLVYPLLAVSGGLLFTATYQW